MKNLKISLMFILLVSFMACKKDSTVVPEPIKEPFDIRQYVLVLKTTKTNGWVSDLRLITFEAQKKSIIFTLTGPIPDNGYNYTYENGVLKVFYDFSINFEFKVENEVLTPIRPLQPGISVKLIKIPSENALNGNSYNGSWRSEGSLVFAVAALKFSDTHYSEASFNLPEPNTSYQLIKNIAAYREDKYVRKEATLWLLVDGKLDGYRTYYDTGNKVNGTFTKQ